MALKYRIYINEKIILLTTSVPKKVENYQKIDAQTFDLKAFYLEFNDKPKGKVFFILCEDAKAFLKKLMKSITVIDAAGGLVKNEKGEYLFIYRKERWDLPKGKVEKGESMRQGGLREVEEECGIAVSELRKKICKTYHTYTEKGEVVLKRTHWYKMTYTGLGKLKPQKEEGITDVRWFKKAQIDTIVKNTFPSIVDVLAKCNLLTEMPAPLSE